MQSRPAADVEHAGQSIIPSFSLLLFLVTGGAAVQLFSVVREPQRWILVPEPWMGTLAVQRVIHVVLGVGPVVWVALWAVLGMELDALLLRKLKNRIFQLDRVSFLAFWLIAYLGGPVLLSHLLHGHWSTRFLIISPYLSAPVLLSRLLYGHWLTRFLIVSPFLFAPLATIIAIPIHMVPFALLGGRRALKPPSFSMLAPWAVAFLLAIAIYIYWPLHVPSSVGLGWAVPTLVVGIVLVTALWRLKATGLERILQRFSDNSLRKPHRPAFLLAALLVTTMVSGIRVSGSAGNESRLHPNVILITLDTIRADRMGCYGYHLKTTPKLDVFGGQSTIFTKCMSTAPYTAPAVWSIMTSKYRTVHSVGLPGSPKIITNQQTLARVLAKNGYRTAAFISNSVLHRKRRFYQGFDIYDDTFTSFTLTRGLIERTAEKTNEYVLNWLDTVGDQRFFLWVHYQDPHGPYIPPEHYLRRLPERMSPGTPEILPVTDNDGKGGIPMYQYINGQASPSYYRQRYDGEIAYADDFIGSFLERVKELGLWNRSIVVFTADHGESMGEHGYYFCHGHDLTEDLIHVPLIVHIPGTEQIRRVDELVSIIDLAPTMLAAVGLKEELGGSGLNLMPLIQGKTRRLDREYVIAEDLSNRICFRSREMKYVAGSDSERLYNLIADSDELNNILEERPELAVDWRAIRGAYQDQQKARTDGAPRYAPHDVENLRSLGYIK